MTPARTIPAPRRPRRTETIATRLADLLAWGLLVAMSVLTLPMLQSAVVLAALVTGLVVRRLMRSQSGARCDAG